MAATFNASDFRTWAAISSTEQRALVNDHGTRECCNYPNIGLASRAPVLNAAAHPRWGRNHNSPGEDRYVIGVFGRQSVLGLQEGFEGEDTGTNAQGQKYVKILSELKHAFAYEHENDRFGFTDVLTWFDLMDTYLPAFENTIREASPYGYMCSYPASSVDGGPSVPFCASETFSSLALSWGFGNYSFIESDCGALEAIATQHHYVDTIPEAAAVAVHDGRADLNCGQVYCSKSTCGLSAAYSAGNVTRQDLEDVNMRTTMALMSTGAFDNLAKTHQPLTSYHVETHMGLPESQMVSQEQARRGFVLLKNDQNYLPISPSIKSIAVIGPLGNFSNLAGDYFGQICPSGDFSCLTTIFDELKTRVPSVTYASGCIDVSCASLPTLSEAVGLAKAADLVLFAIGDDLTIAHEAIDRTNISLPGLQQNLVEAVLQAVNGSKPIVTAVITGETVDLEFLKSTPSSVFAGFYPGPRGAQALADVMFGKDANGTEMVNIFGKLPFTMMPESFAELTSSTTFKVTPNPDLGLTYRWYIGDIVYRFGSGLTYSNFTISNLVASTASIPSTLPVTAVVASTFNVTVSNVGSRDAAEVVMLYASATSLAIHASEPAPTLTAKDISRFARPSIANHPIRSCPTNTPTPFASLIGFARVVVPANSSVVVSVPVESQALALATCNNSKGRSLLSGTYQISAALGPPEDDLSTMLSVPLQIL